LTRIFLNCIFAAKFISETKNSINRSERGTKQIYHEVLKQIK